jgi:predicted DNA-binding transcriptional regulator AlpA
MTCARAALKCLARLLTKQDLARRYGVSVRTIDDWRFKGRLPEAIYPVPSAPRWCPAELERWEKGRTGASASLANP